MIQDSISPLWIPASLVAQSTSNRSQASRDRCTLPLPNPLLFACVKGSSDDCAGTMTTRPRSHPHLILQKVLNTVPHSSSAIAHPHGCTMGTHGHQPLTRLVLCCSSSMWLNISALVSSVLHAPSSSFSNTSLHKESKARAQQITYTSFHTVLVSANAVPVIPSEI
jgi:hypothetical protein